MDEGAQADLFIYPDTFKTEYGDELDLPRPTAKIEKQVFRLAGTILEEVPSFRTIIGQFRGTATEGSEDLTGDIIDVIQLALTKVPEPALELASVILGKTVEETEDLLTYADIIRLVLLFFRLQTSRFAGAASRLGADLGATVDAITESAAVSETATADEASS